MLREALGLVAGVAARDEEQGGRGLFEHTLENVARLDDPERKIHGLRGTYGEKAPDIRFVPENMKG